MTGLMESGPVRFSPALTQLVQVKWIFSVSFAVVCVFLLCLAVVSVCTYPATAESHLCSVLYCCLICSDAGAARRPIRGPLVEAESLSCFGVILSI